MLPSKKVLASGVVAGAAAGAWAVSRLRTPVEESGPIPGLIDWEQARSIAVNMNRAASLTAVERQRLDSYYTELVGRAVPVVERYIGISLPHSAVSTHAFDRVDWINANIDAFREMLAPFETLAHDESAKNATARAMAGLNRRIVSFEVGILLGYLSRRVLGQYDIALLGREQIDTGKLYYVEPNIRHIESSLQLPSDDFRMWLALHETTHVFEFEGFSWVRPYFNGMLEEYFGYLKEDAQLLGQGLKNLKIFVERARSGDSGSSWIEHLMNDQQRDLFNRMQTMMSVIEGYSNHVMNAVGRDLLANYEPISRKFEYRQAHRSQAEQLFAKLTGLDMKMEQYRLGEQFIDAIATRKGHDLAVRVWEGPEMLPTPEELRNPLLWIERVDRDHPDIAPVS
ncbi:MAG: zinc-dependent metalloprotease [Thermomicrobiales bacterium]|nr:zinc-dependent metalloprotease [Thermomicrobiales bacterium]